MPEMALSDIPAFRIYLATIRQGIRGRSRGDEEYPYFVAPIRNACALYEFLGGIVWQRGQLLNSI